MKKLLFGLIVALMAGSLISWNWAKTQFSPVNKADVVECLNMETQQAYKLEASTPKFASLHPAPLVV